MFRSSTSPEDQYGKRTRRACRLEKIPCDGTVQIPAAATSRAACICTQSRFRLKVKLSVRPARYFYKGKTHLLVLQRLSWVSRCRTERLHTHRDYRKNNSKHCRDHKYV